MKAPLVTVLGFFVATSSFLIGAPDPNWADHDRERPLPAVINPGTFSSQDQPGQPPSDATVLFGGADTSAWVAMDGTPTKWVVRDGAFECVPGSGYARTFQSFGDCQLHVEWSAPNPPHGDSQGRGNSGVFFGFGRYEIQVLDSYQNKTYADGSAASIYGQYPPLVNASLPPGKWQIYDIVWTSPRFDTDGSLLSKARLTIFHNGVLVQNNVELTGPVPWIGRPPYKAHPERLPIALQDHGNPVRYRNVWVRELGNYRRKEVLLPEAELNTYVGDYGPANQWNSVVVRRLPDGQLSLSLGGADTVLHAEGPNKFYALTTDIRCSFDVAGPTKAIVLTVGDDEVRRMERRTP